MIKPYYENKKYNMTIYRIEKVIRHNSMDLFHETKTRRKPLDLGMEFDL